MAKYDPILSQSINFPDRLFCCLTNDLVEKTPGAIQRHVGGKRFARAKGARLARAGLTACGRPALPFTFRRPVRMIICFNYTIFRI